MNNLQVIALQEFRRFVNTYVYPEFIEGYIIPIISQTYNSKNICFKSPSIEFDNCTSIYDNVETHIMLKDIFIKFFNIQEVNKFIKNKIYTSVTDENLKQYLNTALYEIQTGNQQYVSLLFNITFLPNNMVYLYL